MERRDASNCGYIIPRVCRTRVLPCLSGSAPSAARSSDSLRCVTEREAALVDAVGIQLVIALQELLQHVLIAVSKVEGVNPG